MSCTKFCVNDMRSSADMDVKETVNSSFKIDKIGKKEKEVSDYAYIQVEFSFESSQMYSDHLYKRILKLNTGLMG